MAERLSLLGVSIDEMTPPEAVARIRAYWHTPGRARRVFFVNAHCLNVAASDHDYRDALAMAELVLADGSGVLLAAKLLQTPITHNLNGTDLGPTLCEAVAADGGSVFLLGARPGVAEQSAARLLARYPRLRIAGIQHGYFDPANSAEVVAQINAARPDMLLVALGVPLQELWITQHAAELNVPVCLAVGALFDFLSESVARAPWLLRRLGIEWLYRLYQEPRRLWRRYLLGNVRFVARVLAARCLGVGVIAASPYTQGALPASDQRTGAPAVVAEPSASARST